MVTGYEVEFYHNVKRIADTLERIAKVMEEDAHRNRASHSSPLTLPSREDERRQRG